MPGGGADIVVRLLRNEDQSLPIIPLSVGQDLVLEMVPYPASPGSTISQAVHDELVAKGIVPPDAGPNCTLTDLRIEGQVVPPLTVEVGNAPGRLQVDGLLGSNFFRVYVDVSWGSDFNQLTLIDP